MRKTKHSKALLLAGVLMVSMCLPAFAASYHTGIEEAEFGAGSVYVDAYVYYSSNTSSSISITSVVEYISHSIPLLEIDEAIAYIYGAQSASPDMHNEMNLGIGPNVNTRVEVGVYDTFSKSGGYVMCQARAILGSADVDGLEIPGYGVGWDIFFEPNSTWATFHS